MSSLGHLHSSQNIESASISFFYNIRKQNRKLSFFILDCSSTSWAEDLQPIPVMTHEKLENKSTYTTKVTNWSQKSTADYAILQIIKKFLIENSHFIALKGRIETKTEKIAIMHCMIKYEKPVQKSSILKQIKECQYIPDNNTSLYAVTQSDNVRLFLETIPSGENYENKHDLFEKGVFKYSRSNSHLKQDAGSLIEKHGLSTAKYIWTIEKRPHTVFEQAEAQYKWEEAVKIGEELKEQAKKRLEDLYPWQQYVHNLYLSTPDDRSIYVILDEKGGSGKTYLQNMFKNLYSDTVVDIRNGKTADMTKLAQNGGTFKMAQLNLSRQEKGKVNLSAVEEIKDGNFASTKYSSKTIRIPPPHFFIYTNMELKWNDMTRDRWKIIHLYQEYEKGFKVYTLPEWIDFNPNPRGIQIHHIGTASRPEKTVLWRPF